VVAALAVAGQAAAESGRGLGEARERFDRGADLFERGDLEAALAEFNRAYELAPNSAVLYNIGSVQARLRRYTAAVSTLARYLEEGGQSVPADRRVEVERELVRLRALVGFVAVAVRPGVPAVVFVDGVEAGRAPLASPLVVSAGSHVIEVRAEGFLPYRSELSVAGGAEARVDGLLTRAETPGAILVSVAVPYATVTVDGEVAGTTPLEEPVNVQPGRHVVEVTRPGYAPARAEVEVSRGGVARAELELSPLPDLPPELAGGLDVRVSERGTVRFTLDGEPLSGDVVPVGPHRVDVRLEGFEPWSGEVEVERGRPTQLEVRLTPTANFRERYVARARAIRISSYLLLGVGGALAVTGAGLELWNSLGRQGDWQAEDDLLQAQYRLADDDPARLPGEQLGSRQDANDELAAGIGGLRAADIALLAVGGAGVVAGVLMLVLGPDPARYSNVSLAPGPGGLALTW
jgi:hypothetical protein